MALNRAEIIGHLGQDPEIRTFQNGDKVANLSVATTDKWTDRNTGEKREATEWHRVTITGGLVGVVERYLSKGSKVYLAGKLQTRKWQAQDGSDRWSTEIRVAGFGGQLELLGEPRGAGSGGGGGSRQDPPASGDIDDDIPF